jgi:glutamate-1-semialdehyde 2,1-aminomutase
MDLKSKTAKEIWKRAEEIIPGGNGLLSKRPDRYAPDIWPTYFKKCKGVLVTDLNDRHYIDMAQMGIGSAILGYANDELNEYVNSIIKDGVNCTLNSIEEVLLAEKLLELNPFAGGVKFARTGGEAMAIAVRIARAYSGKTKVLFSGYHGWTDWYLAANISSSNALNNHLIPGLEPRGVPPGLQGTAIPFNYDDLENFEKVFSENKDCGIICIEGARNDYPNNEFLEKIMYVAKKYNIIIISDEITSGWRVTDGGVYKINGFKPDIVVYGKALGGGFAISAIVGKKDIMSSAQNTFISSTMWTERVGFAAGLKTVEILTRDMVWKNLIRIGKRIIKGWSSLIKRYDLNISISNFEPLVTMKFNYGDRNQEIITLFVQEMLSRGYLASTSIYVSNAHTEGIVDEYLINVDLVFKLLSEAILSKNIKKSLKTSVRSDSFKRLTK